MKAGLIGLAMAVVAAGSTLAQERESDPAIEAVISGQIEAFKADDFDRAFTYASPGIQGMFGTADRFGAMVRQGYPMVHRPTELRFLDLRDENGSPHQKVVIRDAGGAYHVLDYDMERSEGGGWLIDGVQVLRAADVGA
jgi:hypothetical protein